MLFVLRILKVKASAQFMKNKWDIENTNLQVTRCVKQQIARF